MSEREEREERERDDREREERERREMREREMREREGREREMRERDEREGEHSNLKSTIKLCSSNRAPQCCMLRSLARSLAQFTSRLLVSTISRFSPSLLLTYTLAIAG